MVGYGVGVAAGRYLVGVGFGVDRAAFAGGVIVGFMATLIVGVGMGAVVAVGVGVALAVPVGGKLGKVLVVVSSRAIGDRAAE